jgi:hypothetical protein
MNSESLLELTKRLRDLKKKQIQVHKEADKIDSEINILENIVKLKTERKVKSKIKGIYKDEIPTDYNDDLFKEQKVIFIINQLKAPTVREIAQFMHIASSGKESEDSLYKRAQQVVIKLGKEHKVLKIGDYNSKYKLNIIDLKTAGK